MKKFDLIIAGAGSGGIGAAWAATKCGMKALMIEKNCFIGGTFTSAGVSCWEASVSGTGLSEIIYKQAASLKGASDIYPHLWDTPEYDLTLKVNGLDLHDRINGNIKGRYGVIIEPDIYTGIVQNLLKETGNCELLCNTELVNVRSNANTVQSITVDSNGRREELEAAFFIDSTGDITLAEFAGCEMTVGAENRDTYNEPHAPPVRMPERLNGASLIFRVTADPARILKRPEWTSGKGTQRPKMSPWMKRFPNGDWYINPLPTFTGEELKGMNRQEAYLEAVCRTWDIWEEIKGRRPELSDFGICWIAPELGVREGKRIISEYVLTENDITDGILKHKYDDVIAVADHMFDMHGVKLENLQLLQEPYGVPLRALIPKGWRNLLVACRGGGFSQIAASSCRLSRTMMQLGQAAGTAVSIAVKENISLGDLNYRSLRKSLESQGVVLDKATLEKRYHTALERSGAKEIISKGTIQ